MIKRNKAILCALVGIGFITSAGTVKANAMTNTTTKKATFKASQVEDWMYKFPYTFKMNIGDQLKAGVGMAYTEYAYSTLGDKQDYVDPGALNNLRQAEQRLETLLEGEQQAYNIVCRISELADGVGYNKNTKKISAKETLKNNEEYIKNIKEEIVSIEDTFNTLDYSIRYSKGLSSYMNELYDIELDIINSGL